jgi:hypothetical protein
MSVSLQEQTPENTPEIERVVSINFEDIRNNIINDDIIPTLKHEIDSNYTWRYRWNLLARCCGSLAQVLTCVGSIFSFIAANKEDTTYSFVAGILGVVTISISSTAVYAKRQKREKTININTYLKKVGVRYSLPESIDNDSKH